MIETISRIGNLNRLSTEEEQILKLIMTKLFSKMKVLTILMRTQAKKMNKLCIKLICLPTNKDLPKRCYLQLTIKQLPRRQLKFKKDREKNFGNQC